MAKLKELNLEAIEILRGIVDIYNDKRLGPIARAWPKKIKPPYTPLQAEAQAVFSIANKSMSRLSDAILEAWRQETVGNKASWTDVYRGIIMGYWKKTREVAPIAIDYTIEKTESEYKVTWKILQLYIDPEVPEEVYDYPTIAITIEELQNAQKPVYFTLLDDDGTRLCAPYVRIEDIV